MQIAFFWSLHILDILMGGHAQYDWTVLQMAMEKVIINHFHSIDRKEAFALA